MCGEIFDEAVVHVTGVKCQPTEFCGDLRGRTGES
jgi:hypothetical protein